jgi:hypothetical protein
LKERDFCFPDKVAWDIFRKSQKADIDKLLENCKKIIMFSPFQLRFTEKEYAPPLTLNYLFKTLDFFGSE